MTDPPSEDPDPLDELARENEVIGRLDERLGELALGLRTGTEPSPGEIAEGLRLFEQYVGVHALRFDEALEPEARPVAMSSCSEHLDAIHQDRAVLPERLAPVRTVLGRYAPADPERREALARELATLAQHEHEKLDYENDVPLSCLRAALPDDAARRVARTFDRTQRPLEDLEGHIERYLHREPGKATERFPVRCAHSGCPRRSEAESYPAERGHLGIRGPTGWKVVPRPPKFTGGVVTLGIDFWCPDHVPAPAPAAPSTLRGGPGAEPIGSEPSTPSHGEVVPPARA